MGSSLVDDSHQKFDEAPEVVKKEVPLKSSHEFPSLKSKKTSRSLFEHISRQRTKLNKEFNEVNHIDPKQKTRKNVKENFSYTLQLGV